MAINPRQANNLGNVDAQTRTFVGSRGSRDIVITNPGDITRQRRLNNLPNGAEPSQSLAQTATFLPTDDTQPDWRVKISVPTLSTFRSSAILQPLATTGYNVVFPVTPNVNFVTSAIYEDFSPVHSNYPFPSYVNSRTEDITVSGSFPVQTQEDGLYWLAAVHLFRSLTKMFYGETSDKGAPPPVVKLNGYGSYVMNNIPVVITQMTFDLPNNVDYLQVGAAGITPDKYQMVPTNSQINVTCRPVHSRAKVSEFSLDNFVSGNLADKGFI